MAALQALGEWILPRGPPPFPSEVVGEGSSVLLALADQAHEPRAGLEPRGPGLRDLQWFPGLRVAAGPCGLVHHLEGPEPGDRHLVLARHGRLDRPQDRVEGRAGLPAGE